MGNYKIVIIVGAIVLVVGLIILISGIISSTKQTNIVAQSTNDKLLELKNLLDNGLITQDEYDEKKKSLLEKL